MPTYILCWLPAFHPDTSRNITNRDSSAGAFKMACPFKLSLRQTVLDLDQTAPRGAASSGPTLLVCMLK